MRAKFVVVTAMILLASSVMLAQTDVIGSHDLSPAGTSPVKGTLSGSCLYCHAPHSGLNGTAGVNATPLWNQKLSNVQSYTVYTSTTMVNSTNPSLTLGSDSTLCLSCHDGTVAGSPGALVAYGQVPMSGQMNSADVFGANLTSMHPFSFILPLKASPSLVPSLTTTPPTTADPTRAVHLVNGNVECTSCHNPHVQNIDPNNPNFLAIDNTNSALCLACHTTAPTGSGMGMANMARAFTPARALAASPPMAADPLSTATPSVSSTAKKANPLAGWSGSIHATAPNRVARQVTNSLAVSKRAVMNSGRASLGGYGTVAKNGCLSCHATHNAQGGKSLLLGDDDQTCITCHNGSSNVSPPPANVLSEMIAPKSGHAFSACNTPHREQEAALLNQNRHAACVDCHNPHSSNRGMFTAAPAIRASQNGVVGISATDGVSVVNPAMNQYENCLRCHGSSTGKQARMSFGYLPAWAVSAGDPLNIIPQFSLSAMSSHPVMHDRSSTLPQPSLRTSMLNLDGRTPGRSIGTRILCTDCHNSDDNREFGGSGPNGPHGSIFAHIIERRYEYSQAPAPGKLITNLFPNPSLSAQGGANGGPYALCAKCHDLNQVMTNSSFTEHARHINAGFSCSACHTAHGVGAQSANISGTRLVNFDANVVAPNETATISYDRATGSCSLVCHNQPHQLQSAITTKRR